MLVVQKDENDQCDEQCVLLQCCCYCGGSFVDQCFLIIIGYGVDVFWQVFVDFFKVCLNVCNYIGCIGVIEFEYQFCDYFIFVIGGGQVLVYFVVDNDFIEVVYLYGVVIIDIDDNFCKIFN